MDCNRYVVWIWIILQYQNGFVLCNTWLLEPSVFNGLSIAGRITTIGNTNLERCVVECFSDISCITLGFSEESTACQLYNLDLTDHQFMSWQFNTLFYKSVCTNQKYTYVRRLNICIRRDTTPTTYSDARAICHLDGGDLLKVTTNDARVYLKQIMLDITDTNHYWIGATQNTTNHTVWTWVNGEDMMATGGWLFWADGHPRDTNTECLQISKISSDVRFIDQDCSIEAGFLCEITQ